MAYQNKLKQSQIIVTVFFLALSSASVSPYFAIFAINSIHLSKFQFGILSMLGAISSIILSHIICKNVNVKSKKLLVISLLCALFNYIIFISLDNFLIILLSTCVLGGIGAIALPQLFSIAKNLSSNKLLSMLRIAISIAWVIGPFMAAILIKYSGYRAIFVLAIFNIIIAILFIPNFSHNVVNRKTIRKIKLSKNILIIFIGLFFFNLSAQLLSINLPLYIINIMHGSNQDIAYISVTSALIEIPLILALTKYIKKYNIAIINALCVYLGYLLLLFYAKHTYQIIFLQVLSAGVVATMTSIGMYYFLRFFSGNVAYGSAIYINASQAAVIAASLVFSIKYINYKNSFIFCFIFTIVAMLCYILVAKKTRIQSFHLSQYYKSRH